MNVYLLKKPSLLGFLLRGSFDLNSSTGVCCGAIVPRESRRCWVFVRVKKYFDQANADLILNLQTVATQPLFKRAKLTTAAFSATTNDKILVAV